MKYFFLNGEKYSTQGSISILDIINYFNYNKVLLVIEYNNNICHEKEWSTILLKNKDKIEIVSIVGGG